MIKFRSAVNGVKLHKAVLTGYENGNVTCTLGDGTEYTFDKKDASSIKLDDFDADF